MMYVLLLRMCTRLPNTHSDENATQEEEAPGGADGGGFSSGGDGEAGAFEGFQSGSMGAAY
jgi:uncharacterized membrane protein YgcG